MGLHKLINSLYKQNFASLFLGDRMVFLENNAAIKTNESARKLAEAKTKEEKEQLKARTQRDLREIGSDIAEAATEIYTESSNEKVNRFIEMQNQAKTTEEDKKAYALFNEIIHPDTFKELDGYQIVNLLNNIQQKKQDSYINSTLLGINQILKAKELYLPIIVLEKALIIANPAQKAALIANLETTQKIELLGTSIDPNTKKEFIKNIKDTDINASHIDALIQFAKTDSDTGRKYLEKTLSKQLKSKENNIFDHTIYNKLQTIKTNTNGFAFVDGNKIVISTIDQAGNTIENKVAELKLNPKQAADLLLTDDLPALYAIAAGQANSVGGKKFKADENPIFKSAAATEAVTAATDTLTSVVDSAGEAAETVIETVKDAIPTATTPTEQQSDEYKSKLEQAQKNKYEQYKNQWEKLVHQKFEIPHLNIDGSVPSEEEIAELWNTTNIDGAARVNQILSAPPFGYSDPIEMAKVASAIITVGYNDLVELEDIIDIAGPQMAINAPSLNQYSDENVSERLFESGSSMIHQLESLAQKNPAEFTKLYEQVAQQSFALLEAMSQLKYKNVEKRTSTLESERGKTVSELMDNPQALNDVFKTTFKDGDQMEAIYNYTNGILTLHDESFNPSISYQFKVDAINRTMEIPASYDLRLTKIVNGQPDVSNKVDFENKLSTADFQNNLRTLGFNERYNNRSFIQNPLEKIATYNDKVESEKQGKAEAALHELFEYSNVDSGSWENFIVWANGGVDGNQITMTSMDGQTMTVDRGVLQRQTDPQAAFDQMTNNKEKGLYTLDENGKKNIDIQKTTEEVNRLIKLGFIQKHMQEHLKTGKPASAIKAELDKIDFSKIVIPAGQDLATTQLTEEQKQYFQLGYIADQQSQFTEQLDQSIDSFIKNKPPALQHLAAQLGEKGWDKEKIHKTITNLEKDENSKEIFNRVGLIVGAAMHIENGDARFNGAAIGVPIPIGDGMTIVPTFAVDGNGRPVLSTGINLRLVDGDNSSLDLQLGISTIGYGAGLSTTVSGEESYIDATINGFVGMRWNSIIPAMGGVGLTLSWNVKSEQQREKAALLEGKSYQEILKAWNETPDTDIATRMQILNTQYPRLASQIETYKSEYDLKDSDIVSLLGGIDQAINDKSWQESGSLFVPSIGLQVVFPGPVFVPTLTVTIGETVVSIPNRRATAGIIDEASRTKVFEAIAKLDAEGGKTKHQFIQLGEGMAYNENGDITVLMNKETVDFSNFISQPSIEQMNQGLKNAEIQVQEFQRGGTKYTELTVLNQDRKDIEIVLDPAMEEMGIVKDGNRILIAGSTAGLSITRERHFLPFKISSLGASIQDRIWIGNSNSIKQKHDINYSKENSGKIIKKNIDDKGFSILSGGAVSDIQTNIMDLTDLPHPTKEQSAQLEAFNEKRKHSAIDGISSDRANEMERDYQSQMEAMNPFITQRESYEAQPIRANFDKTLTELYKNTDFKKTFDKNISNQKDLISMITANVKDPAPNQKELNYALLFLQDQHFTEFFKNPANKDKIKQKLESRFDFFDRLYTQEFGRTLDTMQNNGLATPDEVAQAESLAIMFRKDTYKGLMDKVTKGTFDPKKDLAIVGLTPNADFFSGTYASGKSEEALTRNINPALTTDISHLGFLADSVKEYKVNSPSQSQRLLARVMLEMSSPTPVADIDYIRNPLGLSVASSPLPTLLMKGEDYRLVTEILKDQSNLVNPKHKAAFDQYKAIVDKVRAAQISGQAFEQITPEGETLRFTPNTKIESGLYAKCANLSFTVSGFGSIDLFTKENPTISAYNQTLETAQVRMGKASLGIGLGLAISSSVDNVPPGGKHADQGPKAPEGIQAPEGSTNIPNQTMRGAASPNM